MTYLNGSAVAQFCSGGSSLEGELLLTLSKITDPELPKFFGPAEGFLTFTFEIFVGFLESLFPRHCI